MTNAVIETNFPELTLLKRGKVRDLYDLGDSLLMVATDRISAYDVILPDPIPDKGKILTQISVFWFDRMASVVGNHLISAKVDEFPDACRPYAETLRDRSMWVRKTEPLPVECVVRGYISGSGWKSYQKDQTVCGIPLPPGLKESNRLPEPIFTPSTKAEMGEHDINISFDEARKLIGDEQAEAVRRISLDIYKAGVAWAEKKGIIIADTKFEFGVDSDGRLILIDEVLTPDSSRFWPQSDYAPGGAQKSFDKQYVRDYLSSLDWNKEPPGPNLPPEIIENSRQKYLEALTLLTGKSLDA